jgi:acyl carrier protein
VDEMTEQSSLIADLGLDSLDVVNIAVAFEDEFDIEIPDRDIKNLTTIGAIQEYLAKMEVE